MADKNGSLMDLDLGRKCPIKSGSSVLPSARKFSQNSC